MLLISAQSSKFPISPQSMPAYYISEPNPALQNISKKQLAVRPNLLHNTVLNTGSVNTTKIISVRTMYTKSFRTLNSILLKDKMAFNRAV